MSIEALDERQAQRLRALERTVDAQTRRTLTDAAEEIGRTIASVPDEYGSWGVSAQEAMTREVDRSLGRLASALGLSLLAARAMAARSAYTDVSAYLTSGDRMLIDPRSPRVQIDPEGDPELDPSPEERRRTLLLFLAFAAAVLALVRARAASITPGTRVKDAKVVLQVSAASAITAKRWMAETITRTEMSRAYNGAAWRAMRKTPAVPAPPPPRARAATMRAPVPAVVPTAPAPLPIPLPSGTGERRIVVRGARMMKRLVATFDKRTGKDSIVLNGQTVPVEEKFFDPYIAGYYDHPPNRPRDREVVVPWREAWGPARTVEVTGEARRATDKAAADAPLGQRGKAARREAVRLQRERLDRQVASMRADLADMRGMMARPGIDAAEYSSLRDAARSQREAIDALRAERRALRDV